MGNIARLQVGLKKLWTDELYSEAFKDSKSKHKDFDHALKHVLKAAVRMLEITEEADHSGHVDSSKQDEIRKYVADLVICSARLASTAPTGELDLEAAVFSRVERKMNAKIEMEADSEEKRLNQKIDALRKALWDHVRVWNDSSDRNYMLCDICGAHEFKSHQSGCVLA